MPRLKTKVFNWAVGHVKACLEENVPQVIVAPAPTFGRAVTLRLDKIGSSAGAACSAGAIRRSVDCPVCSSVLCVVISGPHLLSRRALMIRIQALVRVALGSRLSHDMRLVCHSSATPISAWYLVTCNGVVAVCKHPYIECVAGSPRFLICCLMIFARCKMSLFMLTLKGEGG